MKKSIWILILAMCIVVCLVLCACGKEPTPDMPNTPSDNPQSGDQTQQGGEKEPEPQPKEFENIAFADQSVEYDGTPHSLAVAGAPEGTKIDYDANSYTEVGTYQVNATLSKEGYKSRTVSATLTVTVPSAQSVVNARANVAKEKSQSYGFNLHMAGTVSLYGYSGTANANYDGQYSYDATSGQFQFVRTTSGLLLYDATEYIMTQGDTRVEVSANDQGTIKAIKILGNEDEELTLINRPFVALIDALQADNLKNIKVATGDYKFCATIALTADNDLVKKALNIIGKQGTTISLKGVSLTNPVNGLILYFNLGADKKMSSFRISTEVSVPISGVDTSITLTYEQKEGTQNIATPNIGNLILAKDKITNELAEIATALDTVKAAADYSLDVQAVNELDPGWNVAATKDQYTARMFKHTYTLNGSEFVAFNHSYEYKLNHQTDGKEKYQYTIGNIQDGSVYLVSRKGTNQVSALDNASVDTQFDYLTALFAFDKQDIDCMFKETKNGVTTYHLYLNGSSVLTVGDKVLGFINANDEEGVDKINNYVDPNGCQISGTEVIVTVQGGAVSGIQMETEGKYYPTGGDYMGKNVTLKDTMILEVNQNLADAKKYEAPKKADTHLVGLIASKYYIN